MLFKFVSFTGSSRTVNPGTSIVIPAPAGVGGNGGSGCLSGTEGMNGSTAKAEAQARTSAERRGLVILEKGEGVTMRKRYPTIKVTARYSFQCWGDSTLQLTTYAGTTKWRKICPQFVRCETIRDCSCAALFGADFDAGADFDFLVDEGSDFGREADAAV